jgi:hypothetical protein
MLAPTTVPPAYSKSSFRGKKTALRAIALGSLICATVLFVGCGGGVSSTPLQASNASGAGAGSGTDTGSATLVWATPTTNTDGTPLTNLAGYKVYYGTTPGVYTSVDVGNVNSYQVNNLTTGQKYYFTVTDYDSKGIESAYSSVVSKTI